MAFNINSKIIQFKTILSKAGILEQSVTIVGSFTNGREESSTKMTLTELNRAIEVLQAKYPQTAAKRGFEAKPGDKMRKKIMAMAHTLGWQVVDTKSGGVKADVGAVNKWCVKYGQFHKPLNKHDESELVKLVSQFEKVDNTFYKNLKDK